jgi:hypothetical protein
VDPIAPVALCKNAVLNLPASGSITLLPEYINNGSSDNCSFNLSVIPATLNCSNLGNTVVTLRATDQSGNTANCTATVTLRDLLAPTALCKDATVFLNNAGEGVLTVSQVNNGSTDNCGITSLTLSQTQYNCSELAGSPWSVTLTLKDGKNNTSTCTAKVTVKDAIAPTAVCENTIAVLNANGKATVYGANLASESSDNCAVWSYSPAAKLYTTANLGNNNLLITVKDWSGNAATCTSIVTVVTSNNTQSNSFSSNNPEAIPADSGLLVYPNPTVNETTLAFKLSVEQSFRIQLFDLSGRLIYDQEGAGVAGDNSINLHLNGLAPGVYLVNFQTDGLKVQKKLVIQE